MRVDELQGVHAQIRILGLWIGSEGLAQTLQESTRPSLWGTMLFLASLLPKPPRQQKLWLVQVKQHPGETIVEVSPRLTHCGITFVHTFHHLHMLESCSCEICLEKRLCASWFSSNSCCCCVWIYG